MNTARKLNHTDIKPVYLSGSKGNQSENIVSDLPVGYMTIEEFRKWGHELVDRKFKK